MLNFRRRIAPLAILAILCTFLSCNSATSTSAVGQLSARVIDANGGGIFGVEADLYQLVGGGAQLWRRSLTSSNGVAVFGASDGGVAVGDYFIRVTFKSNHELAPGQTNDRPVTVGEGDDLVVTFNAVARGPTGPEF
jgi:uncharacterized protein YfaA (DUF2138 family)